MKCLSDWLLLAASIPQLFLRHCLCLLEPQRSHRHDFRILQANSRPASEMPPPRLSAPRFQGRFSPCYGSGWILERGEGSQDAMPSQGGRVVDSKALGSQASPARVPPSAERGRGGLSPTTLKAPLDPGTGQSLQVQRLVRLMSTIARHPFGLSQGRTQHTRNT